MRGLVKGPVAGKAGELCAARHGGWGRGLTCKVSVLSAPRGGGGLGLTPGQAGRWPRGLSDGGAAPGRQCSASERFRGTEHSPAWAPAQTRPSVCAQDPLLPACHPPTPASLLCEPSPKPWLGQPPASQLGVGGLGRRAAGVESRARPWL